MKFNGPFFDRWGYCFIVLIFIFAFLAFQLDGQSSPNTNSPEYEMSKRIIDIVVRVKASLHDEMISGFGFVVGERDNGRLLIVTCNHLVRKFGESAEEINVMFRGSGKWKPSELLEGHYIKPHDFAVLEVQKPLNYAWEKECMSPVYESMKGVKAKFIGRENQWWIPQSDLIINSTVPDKNSIIDVETNLVKPGSSGAPLITRDGIIGMILSDSAAGISRVLSINRMKAAFDKWQYPWSLIERKASIPGPTTGPGKKDEGIFRDHYVEWESFTIKLTGCNVSGQDLVFSFLVTNNGEDNNFMIDPTNTRLFDSSGNEYYAYKVQIGNSVGTRRMYASNSAYLKLVSGIPVKASVRFKGNAVEVSKIRLLEVGVDNYRSFQFRDIPIHSKYYQKPSTPAENQTERLNMVTEIDQFTIELTGCTVLGQDLVFSFLITNNGEDTNFRIYPSRTRIFDTLGNEFYAYKAQIGNNQYDLNQSRLVFGIPVKASVRFKGNAVEGSKIRLLEVGVDNYRSFQFRDIPFHSKYSQKPSADAENKTERIKMVTVIDKFTIELTSCKVSGQDLVFSFLITNNGEDNYFSISHSMTRIIDAIGNEFYAYKSKIGNSMKSKSMGYSGTQLKLVSGIPVKASVSFKGNASKVSKIKLLELITKNGSLQFRDIPFHSKYSQKPSAACENQTESLKIVNEYDKFTIELTSCNVSGQYLVFSFMITNNGEDDNFTIYPSRTRIFDAYGNEFYAYQAQIGNSVDTSGYYYAHLKLVSGIPVKAILRFKGNVVKGSKIELLEVSVRNGSIRFRDIPVSI
jgi:hypothetical protein